MLDQNPAAAAAATICFGFYSLEKRVSAAILWFFSFSEKPNKNREEISCLDIC